MVICSGSDFCPVVSSGTAKAQVVVAVGRVVGVAVRRAHIARVVVPGPAADDTVRAGFSTTLPDTKVTGRPGFDQGGGGAIVPAAMRRHPHAR